MLNTLKKWLGVGTPGGLDDLFIRAVKVAIVTFVGLAGANVIGWTNLSGIQAMGITALGTGLNVIVNAVFMWANS